MKRYITIILSLFLAHAAITLHAQVNNHFIHTVSKGQTLYSISRMYQKSIQEIIELNPGSEKSISVGQKLRIPQEKATVQNIASATKNTEPRYHTIQAGETLYRLGKMYNVSPIEICEANPGLSINNFRTGEVILIPAGNKAKTQATTPAQEDKRKKPSRIRTTHKVEKGETIYSISREYGISIEELLTANPELSKTKKLKKKTIVNIPLPASKPEIKKDVEITNSEIFTKAEEKRDSLSLLADNKATRVAIVLPFLLDSYSPNEQNRMVEYYQGLLIAVDKLKQSGYSFEINTFDSGNKDKSLNQLFASGALDNMDLIIGALYPEHNKELARFAQQKNIPLVIPFTSKEDEIFRNPMVYVVNTMQSYFFSEVIDHFTKEFPNSNVIFVSDSTKSNKQEFIESLTQGLDKSGIPHTTIQMSDIVGSAAAITQQEGDSATIVTIKEVMRADKENIFIPLSSGAGTLSTILPSLIILKNSTIGLPSFKLFGYPEWQIYANELRSQLYEADTYFYASFFSHYSLPEAAKFQGEYSQWYNRNLQNIYPRYGMLGYDTGYTFLLAIAKWGKEMPDNINNISFTPIQTGFKFERVNNWGGMVNKKIYFVHYTPNYNIEKIDFDK
ncbi:MAG: LysM peptidoglycan-binding domain-containing protein [Bacteroidaceae bacterium]|nr:LysM peptidoglycan-binding domain-containing protein [Bacteroidaceae bacterium]